MPGTLVITNDFPPRRGGIESFVADVCGFLDDDVTVLTSRQPGAAAHDAAVPYEVVRHSRVLLPTPGTARLAAALVRRTGARRVLFGAAAPLGLLAETVRRAGADRVVALSHGHEVWWARLPVAKTLLRRIGDGADHLTTISDFTAAAIAPALSARARVALRRLPPPVDLDRFAPATREPDRRPRCVTVCRLVARKGVADLLSAWPLVLDAVGEPVPELVVVGGGPQLERLVRRARRLGVAGSVRFTGPLGRGAVAAELAVADVFALLVRTRRFGLDAEGLGLATVEAAAAGLPVVVGRSGGAPEAVLDGRSGFVVDARDHRAVADRIAGLLADRALAQALGAAGRQHATARFGAPAARDTIRGLLGVD